MTLAEAGKRLGIPRSTLERYVASGFLKDHRPNRYTADDFHQLGLIETLCSAGFTAREVAQYLTLMENGGTAPEQTRMLKKQRWMLLDDIHKKQQLLDHLDYMIWEKNRDPTGTKKRSQDPDTPMRTDGQRGGFDEKTSDI